MAHEIETYTDANGNTQAAAVFSRTPPWHRLGETFERGLTAEDVLDRGHLGGWGVRRDDEPVRDNRGRPVPGFYATSRKNPFTGLREPLGVVGGVWAPIQNEDQLDLLNAIQGQTRGEFETAGSLRNGRAVFVTTKVPDSLLIGGVDAIDRYLTTLNYHDGDGALLLLDTKVRVVCANTERAALGNNKGLVKIRHTTKVELTVAEVRRALNITFRHDEAFEREAERMIQQPLTEAQFIGKIDKLWPSPWEKTNTPSKRAAGMYGRRKLALTELFTDSESQANIRGTAWAGYNAVTEYLDWFTPIGADRDADKIRAARSAEPKGRLVEVKEKAFDLFKVPVAEPHRVRVADLVGA